MDQTGNGNVQMFGITGAAVAGLVAVTRLGGDSLAGLGGLVPVVTAIAVVAALVAASLLTVLARVQHRPALRWVAAGQLAAALTMAVQIGGLPVIAPGGGALGTSAAGAAWLQAIWHMAIPLTALAGVAAASRRLQWPTVACVGLIALMVAWNDRVDAPAAFGLDLRYTDGFQTALAGLAVLSFAAVAVWYRHVALRPNPVEAWIGVSLTLHAFDVALHALADQPSTALWWASLGARGGQYVVLAVGLLVHVARMLHDADPSDATDERRARPEVEGRTDPLTGVLNRQGLLAEADELAGRWRGPAIVVVVDVDGFKAVNDRDGHEGGDRLLQSVASVLRSLTRGGDLVGRWDGDEFVVVFPVSDPSVARLLVDRITTGVSRITAANVGHAVLVQGEAGGLRAALARADVAVYTAKNGRQHAARRQPLRAGTS